MIPVERNSNFPNLLQKCTEIYDEYGKWIFHPMNEIAHRNHTEWVWNPLVYDTAHTSASHAGRIEDYHWDQYIPWYKIKTQSQHLQ